jgi:hypothetical protein
LDSDNITVELSERDYEVAQEEIALAEREESEYRASVLEACSRKYENRHAAGKCYSKVFGSVKKGARMFASSTDGQEPKVEMAFISAVNNEFYKGEIYSADLRLKCRDGQASVWLELDDRTAFPDLTISAGFDDEQPSTYILNTDTEDDKLVFWPDDQALPFIKSTQNKSEFGLAYFPDQCAKRSFRFNIEGMEEHLGKILEGCGG